MTVLAETPVSAILGLDAEPALPKADDEFVCCHPVCSGRDEVFVAVGRDIVVVQVERAAGHSGRVSEGHELFERAIAHQVRPHRSMCRPRRRIDEDGHLVILNRSAPHRSALHAGHAEGARIDRGYAVR